MSPLVAKALRALGVVAYAGLVAVVFLLTAYAAFNVFVHSGGTRTPDLAGLARDDARGHLSDTGLALKVAEDPGRYDPEIPAGHVVDQHPAAGTLVKRGSTVVVTLSLGPQRLTVPDLAGNSAQSAQVALAAAGLALGRVLNVYSTTVQPGTVVEQVPPAGTAVPPATPVELLVSLAGSAPTYVMPDLVYRDYERVRLFFESHGFHFGNVKFEPYPGVAGGVILRQFPVAGHPLARADAISLVVAAREDEEAPAPTG